MKIIINLAVLKPDYFNPKRVYDMRAEFIVFLLVIVGFTVDLDNQFMLTAIKVGNEKRCGVEILEKDGMLTKIFLTEEFTVP
jgi:hypothetical protein